MAVDGRVRVTLPVRYRTILQRHRGSMSDAGFLAWVLDTIDRGVLGVGIEASSIAVAPETVAHTSSPAQVLPAVADDDVPEDEFEDVI